VTFNPLAWWRHWVRPRSTDRDEAFREQTIRVAVAVLQILLITAFVVSVPIFGLSDLAYPLLMLTLIVIFTAAMITVSLHQVTQAGQVLVFALLVASSGVTLIDGYWAMFNQPIFMLLILIAGLVLPRKMLVPVGLLSIGLFAAIALTQEQVGRQPIPVDKRNLVTATETITNIVFLIMVEVGLLLQLRVEFDSRLAAMGESMHQTELARQEADRANQAKSQFLASMTHEFRTPLNAIIGYADILVAGMAGKLSDRQTDISGHIRHNSKRLLGMINNVLDMAKIEAGRVEVHVGPVSPRGVIEDMVGGMRSLTHRHNISLDAVFEPTTPHEVLCDVTKLEQILVNLIGNAIKFTTEGGVTVTVGSEDIDTWTFKVADTGVGMPEDAVSYIFDAFRQVDNPDVSGQEGSGLGLAITHQHVTVMGGRIEVQSEPGTGTTFTVTLPREVRELRAEAA
jgi:signal transduction histidine kinase